MKNFDAIIVGAGPAGSTCAGRLQRSGMKVRLFDKKVFPRVKPCAGWITPQVVQSLRLDLDDYRRSNTLQSITRFLTGVINRRTVETSFNEPVSFGIRRSEFDDYLLRRSGVPCERETIKHIERVGDLIRINDRYMTPLLIGAGGNFCPVASFAKQSKRHPQVDPAVDNRPIDPNRIPTVFAQEVEFEMSARQKSNQHLLPERPELYFCEDFMGYGWCFRKGNFLNIGLGRIDKRDLSGHVQRFCEFLRSNLTLTDELPKKFLGHAYRLYAGQSPMYSDAGLMLIGDSAGLAYSQSGEGIRPAVESALIAANVAIAANGNFGAEALARYEDLATQRFGIAKPMQTVRWLPASWLQRIAERLMATNWFARKIVIENWFLHRDEEALFA